MEQNSGNYTLVITAADLGKLGLKGYLLSIQVSKENYTAPVISLSLTVSLPVDPYFGVPYMYWMIIGVAVIAFVAILGINSYVRYARIPAVIKRINETRVSIKKHRPMTKEPVTPTFQANYKKRVDESWRSIGLEYEEKSSKAGAVTPDFKGPGDKFGGQ